MSRKNSSRTTCGTWSLAGSWRSKASVCLRSENLFANQIDGYFRQEVRQYRNFTMAGQKIAAFDNEALLPCELIEVVNREEMNVGRIVPLIRKPPGFGRAAGEQQRQP